MDIITRITVGLPSYLHVVKYLVNHFGYVHCIFLKFNHNFRPFVRPGTMFPRRETLFQGGCSVANLDIYEIYAIRA